ncbi:MAG: cysteine desulfurase-like protein [Acidobacteriota bacterium]|nr:cysteine desulfurase-like protein [Acidobacteriota bacterium]
MPLDTQAIRKQFPALNEKFDGRPAAFFDNPGGTQVPRVVIDAMADYLTRRNSNTHGAFETSKRTDEVIADAHRAVADLLNCSPDEVVFGNNMTSLTFALSRSLAAELGPGDEIVVTRLDHDANIAPWLLVAADTGATIRWAEIHPDDCTLDMESFRSTISERTKLVAVGYASNATGSINDVATIVSRAREVGALSFVDAVHYAPHGAIDVRAIGCDFLAVSSYKFFGPHAGQLFGKRDHLERLRAYKVRPADNRLPDRWETGTQNHEAMAGVTAAIDYLASLGGAGGTRRERLAGSFAAIREYESGLARRLLDGLRSIRGVRVYGISDTNRLDERVATVSIRKEGTEPALLAGTLATDNIFCWNGNFYALEVCERLGVESAGGLLRIGAVHYNTPDEIDRCLAAIERA